MERAEIVALVDAQVCENCDRPIPDGAAADPQWFVTSEAHVTSQGDAVEIAQIRCPSCW